MPDPDLGAQLDDFADRMRLAAVRRFLERGGLEHSGAALPWRQLMESERNRWRDLAGAAQEAAQ
jgi:hypothetical protein